MGQKLDCRPLQRMMVAAHVSRLRSSVHRFQQTASIISWELIWEHNAPNLFGTKVSGYQKHELDGTKTSAFCTEIS